MNEIKKEFFDAYLQIVREADLAFSRVTEQFGDLVNCTEGCNDCCFALFEMHPVEALYLAHAFKTYLKRKDRREIQRKAHKTRDKYDLVRNEINASDSSSSGMEPLLAMSRRKIECPLHRKGRCVLYEFRPITCRIYGIPTSIQGRGATCGRSGFEPGKPYPTVTMDIIDRRLDEISRALLSELFRLDSSSRRIFLSVAESLIEDLNEDYFKLRLR